MPDGTQMTMRGLTHRRWCTLWMKYRSIFSQISKSAMTPSFSGRIAGVGRAHERADNLERLLGALDDQQQRRAAGDERHEIVEERLAVVLGVVLLRRRLVDRPQFGGDQPKALALEPGDDLAGEA